MYPFALTLGILAGLVWLAWGSARPADLVRIDAGLTALAGGLLGARTGFVLTHAGYYAERPLETLRVWDGGLSWIGAALGAVLATAALARWRKASFWWLADGLALPALAVGLAAWIGCRFDGCAYGFPTEPGPWTPVVTDMFGLSASRFPTQSLGILLSLGSLGLMLWLRGRLKSGQPACLSLSLIAGGSLALAFTRADPRPTLAGLPLDLPGSAAILASAVVGFVLRTIRR